MLCVMLTVICAGMAMFCLPHDDVDDGDDYL